ncbi:MAG TPA: response regulator [Candidatus Gastranaerophilales bacterium]|nr:response regulator [Candidatus Gastranaerophilales bacterium]
MVKLAPQQIKKLYEFIGEIPPLEVTENEISRILVKLEKKFTPYYLQEEKIDNFNFEKNRNILVVDDLEVSLFQLTSLLSKSGYNSFIARTVEEAKDIYKKKDFDYIFVDLFLPEPENGLNLVEEIKNNEQTVINNTKIIVISGSENKKLINQCFSKGADEFICKNKEWHIQILTLLRKFEEIKRGSTAEIKTIIEDEENKIASIKIKNLFKTGIIDDLKREAVNLILSGYNNIVLDLENLNITSPEILNVIVYIFKYSNSNGGSLKLCNVSNVISDALSFVFLDGVIPMFKDKKTALQDFYSKDYKEV